MSINCISCHKITNYLNPSQTNIIQQQESGEWGSDLLLVCSHCEQRYNAWVLNSDVFPLKNITANSPLTPTTTHHKTHEVNTL